MSNGRAEAATGSCRIRGLAAGDRLPPHDLDVSQEQGDPRGGSGRRARGRAPQDPRGERGQAFQARRGVGAGSAGRPTERESAMPPSSPALRWAILLAVLLIAVVTGCSEDAAPTSGPTAKQPTAPTAAPTLLSHFSFVSVSAGETHSCGIRIDGPAECWGNNGFGRATPPDGPFASVSAGAVHTCGVKPGWLGRMLGFQ